MTELCHTGRGLSEEFDEDFQNRLTAYFCRDHEFLTRAGIWLYLANLPMRPMPYWLIWFQAITVCTRRTLFICDSGYA